MEALRFGLFGTGFWAREAHAAAIAAHPHATLAGVWGRNPERAAALAADHGARAYDEIDDLIDAVDAVAVALPPDVQAPIAVRAAAAGRHLLLDKPLAFTSEAADRIVDAVAAGGVRALVFHTSAFTPEVSAWVDALRRAGEWHGGGATWLASIFEPGNPSGASEWRRRKGALWDVGPHALDAILPALGTVDDLVAARGRGDTVHVVLHHAGRASSTMTVSLTAPPAAELTSAWVYGPSGISHRPEPATPPLVAYGNAISALLADGPDGWPGHRSDVRHGAEIVRVLERAEAYLS